MIILGISDTHDAGACLLVDGEVVAAASEERFSRLKSDADYPVHSIDFCLSHAGITTSDLDKVAVASKTLYPVFLLLKRAATFSVSDWHREMEEYWYPRQYEDKKLNHSDYALLFDDLSKPALGRYGERLRRLVGTPAFENPNTMRRIRTDTITDHLGVSADKIEFVTHEHCHAQYGYWASPIRDSVIVMISEGSGDYSNGSAFKFENGQMSEVVSSRGNHCGHMYKLTTLILGMKPGQHEYKTMGLAPYTSSYHSDGPYEIFKELVGLDGIEFVRKKQTKDLFFYLRDALKSYRFDGIAGGLQRFIEEIHLQWAHGLMSDTGINNLIFSGGVAQNIKACKVLMDDPAVDRFWVSPISGDGSIHVGAAYAVAAEALSKQGLNPLGVLQPLRTAYLGPEYDAVAVERALEPLREHGNIRIEQAYSPQTLAAKLADGKVMGRFSGRMEFGQRALGNRSIVADARDPLVVKKINEKIKYRDFWMPFTPSILDRRVADYIDNRKNTFSPFMTIAFDSTPLAVRDLIGALHQGDLTVRPQMLSQDANPGYYALLSAMEQQTGVGGVLNTSLNTHGDAMVCSPEDAVATFLKSDLDLLAFDAVTIERTDQAW